MLYDLDRLRKIQRKLRQSGTGQHQEESRKYSLSLD